MHERVAQLESSVAALQAEVAALRARVAALDAGPAAAVPQPSAIPAIPDVAAAQLEGWLALAGRTLVILGGAYLLRAITSAQVVSYTAGVAAGLVYGAPWLLLASRAGSRGRRLDAFCYGVSTALIGYPLVWEATIRFAVFTPAESALLLGALTAAAFGLAAVWRLHSLAAIITCGALASTVGLAIATDQWLPYTALAIAVGFATLWLGYLREWVLLRWPAALVVDLMMVVLTGRTPDRFWPVLFVQLIAIGGYLGSFAGRTLREGRRVVPFEVAQSAGILAILLPTLLVFVAPQPAVALAAAAAILAAGAAAYAVSFTMVERRAQLANLFFYSLLALTLTLTGASIALPSGAPVLFAAAGVTAAVAARHRSPLVLWMHSVLFAAAAAISSGLLAAASAALVAPSTTWSAPAWTAWIALGCSLVTTALAPRRAGPAIAGIAVARLVLGVLVIWTVSGSIVYLVVSVLERVPGWDAAWLATVRTGVAVAATLGASYASRRDAWREAAWLAYPLLVLLGAKLALSDFPAGRPLTLFIALAAYGLALIVTPRAGRERPDSTRAPGLQPSAP
jgi:hypothetical protein